MTKQLHPTIIDIRELTKMRKKFECLIIFDPLHDDKEKEKYKNICIKKRVLKKINK